MNGNAPTPPTKEGLLQMIVDLGKLRQSVSEAAEQTLVELGLDSLGFVELTMGLEDALKVTLDLDNLSPYTRLSDLADQILAGAYASAVKTAPRASAPPAQAPVVEWLRGVSFKVDLPNFTLRSLGPDDVNADYVSWWNDAEIQGRLGAFARGWGLADARRHVDRFDIDRDLHLGIFDRAEERLVGFYTIFTNKRTGVATTNRVIGDKSYWRKGISKELSVWSIPFIFQAMGMEKISASIHGENHSSMWLVEYFGFQREGVLRSELPAHDGGRLDVYKYGLLRSDWERMVHDAVAPWGQIS
ncbi:MAG: GNAT family N-acetyltransferase [Schleiferiaceae bacterium]